MVEPEPKVAWLAGASGLVGSQLLEALLDAPDFARVIAISRRALGREAAQLANRIVQFDQLEAQLKGLSCHTAFCCLGTTLRRAGSEQAFEQVVQGYVVAFARAAHAARAQRFVLLSCSGADRESRSFDQRIRGAAEAAVAALNFTSLDILQPGTLLGLRRGAGTAEMLHMTGSLLANPLRVGMRGAHRAIAATTVALGMLGAARSLRRGIYRYGYSDIQTLSTARRRT